MLPFVPAATALDQSQDSVVGVALLTLRKSPSFLSRKTGELKYGQKIKILKTRKDWCFITAGSFKGWAQKSALGERESILDDLKRSSAESSATYNDEVATAGKGFSAEYESMLKQKNQKLNFGAVDKMESIELPVKTLLRFKKKGRLQSEVLR